jgi:hypothetical protein
MPNNFMFDQVAQDLKTMVYGLYDSTTAVALAVDAQGNLDVGVAYTTSTATVVLAASGSGGALTLDSSEKGLYSYYVKNVGDTTTVSVKLQVAPVTDVAYFVDDSSTSFVLGPDDAAVLIPKYYLHWTRLFMTNEDGASTATVQIFYDARQ